MRNYRKSRIDQETLVWRFFVLPILFVMIMGVYLASFSTAHAASRLKDIASFGRYS